MCSSLTEKRNKDCIINARHVLKALYNREAVSTVANNTVKAI